MQRQAQDVKTNSGYNKKWSICKFDNNNDPTEISVKHYLLKFGETAQVPNKPSLPPSHEREHVVAAAL